MANDWILGVDYGTTFTVAAVHRGDRTEILEIDGNQRLSSAVFLAEDGSIVVGAAAERRGAATPERLERNPKRYLDLGQPPITLGVNLVDVTSLVAATMRTVWDEALRQHQDQPPVAVVITHPAGWGARRRALLEAAGSQAGLTNVQLLPEPEAAALYLASERAGGVPVGRGEYVAVYDLGGGTFDAALLRRSQSGFELVGEPGGDARIGGETFDDRIYRHLGRTALDDAVWAELQGSEEVSWRWANWEFRRGVREAKEAVSRDATCPIYVPPPVGRELLLTRGMVEALVEEDIRTTFEILAHAIESAGVSSYELSALYLAGGACRMPLVGHLVRERFSRADTKGDPKCVVALGAALAGAMPGAIAAGHTMLATHDEPDAAGPVPANRRKRLWAAPLALALLACLVLMFQHLPRSSHDASAEQSVATTTPLSVPPASVTPLTTLSSAPLPTDRVTTPTAPLATTATTNGMSVVAGALTYQSSGVPYSDANVEFISIQGGWNRQTDVDSQGRYSLELPAGMYRVHVMSNKDILAAFTVVGRSSDNVDVPQVTEVDFTESETKGGADYKGL